MKVHVQKLGNIRILRLQGRMVIGESETLRRVVAAHEDASAVVFDLARVSRIDARGLGVLLQLRKEAILKGIQFRIMNVKKLVQQVLDITKLNSVFEITTERELSILTHGSYADYCFLDRAARINPTPRVKTAAAKKSAPT